MEVGGLVDAQVEYPCVDDEKQEEIKQKCNVVENTTFRWVFCYRDTIPCSKMFF